MDCEKNIDCAIRPTIVLYRGDDTDFVANANIIINISTDISRDDLAGGTIYFKYLSYEREFALDSILPGLADDEDISISLDFSKEDTLGFPLGIGRADIYIIDSAGKKRTVSNLPDILVTSNPDIAYMQSTQSTITTILADGYSGEIKELKDSVEELDEKVDDLIIATRVDTTPTSGSSNPVSSGGVYTALQNKLSTSGGRTTAGAVITFLGSGMNPTVGGTTITLSSQNNNNTTSYVYSGIAAKRNGVNSDYLFDDSTNGIARFKDLGYTANYITYQYGTAIYTVKNRAVNILDEEMDVSEIYIMPESSNGGEDFYLAFHDGMGLVSKIRLVTTYGLYTSDGTELEYLPYSPTKFCVWHFVMTNHGWVVTSGPTQISPYSYAMLPQKCGVMDSNWYVSKLAHLPTWVVLINAEYSASSEHYGEWATLTLGDVVLQGANPNDTVVTLYTKSGDVLVRFDATTGAFNSLGENFSAVSFTDAFWNDEDASSSSLVFEEVPDAGAYYESVLVDLKDRTVNHIAIGNEQANEYAFRVPNRVDGKARDFILRLDNLIGGSATIAFLAANEPYISLESDDDDIFNLDFPDTLNGEFVKTTVFYFTESAPGVFYVSKKVPETLSL